MRDYLGDAGATIDAVLLRAREHRKEGRLVIPEISVSVLGPNPGAPLLVVGPSLGTSASTLWSAASELLADDFHVLAWDLPGHGTNKAVADGDLTMAELAAGVLAAVDRDPRAERGHLRLRRGLRGRRRRPPAAPRRP